MTPDLQAKILIWRQRIAAGQPLSIEEEREAITALRAGRIQAQRSSEAAGKKRSAAKVATQTGEDMLKELEGL